MKLGHLLLYSLMVGFIFYSCGKDEVITEIDGINKNVENSPSIANKQNSFAFDVKANLFNSVLEYPVTFDKTSFDLALAITNYTAGDVSIQLSNDAKQMLYKGDFNQNTALAQTITLEEKPTKIKLIFSGFTASLSCSLTGK